MSGSAVPSTPWQFSLQHLLLAIAAVCVAGAGYQWLGPGVSPVIGLVLFLGCLGLAIRQRSVGLVVAAIGTPMVIIWLLLPSVSHPRSVARASSCQNNLRFIGIALQSYHDDHGCFPPAYVADAAGRPMHSWRVLLLPYLEERALFDRYDLNEPWNGPNNSKLISEIPKVYRCPSEQQPIGPFDTSYLAVVGTGTIWRGEKPVSMSDVRDGSSNTLLLVESHGSGINWTEPRDLSALSMAPVVNCPKGQGICSCHNLNDYGRGDFAHVLLGDCAVKRLDNGVTAQEINALLTISGGEMTRWP